MSGLLRRIKRSRPADAGETPAEGHAAAPEGAAMAAEPAAPAIARDPATPAGLEPGDAAARSPAGRAARLRRRLRYLRRAREVMLRDLGGLVYEVHRSGDGDYVRHERVIGTKVERLRHLDAETGAIESALAAPRSEAVVFQPGVGGTCGFCGELYGSAARFCSHCGSPTGSAVRATPAVTHRTAPVVQAPPGESASRVLGAVKAADMPTPPARAEAKQSGVEPQRLSPGGPLLEPRGEIPPTGAEPAPAGEATAATPADEATPEDTATAAREATRAGEQTPAEEAKPASETTAADEPKPAEEAKPADASAADEPTPAGAAKPADEPKPADEAEPAGERAAGEAPTEEIKAPADEPGEPGRNPFAGLSNGRAEDDNAPPELSSGDPLASRESRQ